MRKEDYMKLSKERLAELLEEYDNRNRMHSDWSYFGENNTNLVPCWAPGGYCSNPYRDCINCPRPNSGQYITTCGFQTNSHQVNNNVKQETDE